MTTYYVDPVNGLDSNNGAIGTPWQHIGYAIGGGSVSWVQAPPSTQTIPGSPYQLTVGTASFSVPIQDYGVVYASGPNTGNSLTQIGVPGTIGTGQYKVDLTTGIYYFSSGDSTVSVTITYGQGTAIANTNPNKPVAGDTILLAAGTYKEYAIVIDDQAGSNSGTDNTHRITLQPSGSQYSAIIDGGFVWTNTPLPWPAGPETACIVFGNGSTTGASWWTINNLKLTRGGVNGFHVGVNSALTKGLTVSGNEISFCPSADNGAGLECSGSMQNLVITNNKIHDNVGYNHTLFAEGSGFICFSGASSYNNYTITNNEIYNETRAVYHKQGVPKTSTHASETPLVQNNYIHDISSPTNLGAAGIASITDGMIINNNLLVNIKGNGIYIYGDEEAGCSGCTNHQITHNTIITEIVTQPSDTIGIYLGVMGHCPNVYSQVNGATNTLVKNNVVYGGPNNAYDGIFQIWEGWTNDVNIGGPPKTWQANESLSGTNFGGTVWRSPRADIGHPLGFTSQPFDFICQNPGITGASEPDWTKSNQHPVSGITAGDTITDNTITWIVVPKQKHLTTSDYNLFYDTRNTSNPKILLYDSLVSYTFTQWKTNSATDYGTNNTAQDQHSLVGNPIFRTINGLPYALDPTSPGYQAASDGKDMGADMTQIITTSQTVPVVVTGSASSVSTTSATLNGTANPEGDATGEAYFEWGLTTSYGNTTANQSITGSSPVAVSQAISGLTKNTIYHFRIDASNTGGTTLGSDQTFTTENLLPIVLPSHRHPAMNQRNYDLLTNAVNNQILGLPNTTIVLFKMEDASLQFNMQQLADAINALINNITTSRVSLTYTIKLQDDNTDLGILKDAINDLISNVS